MSRRKELEPLARELLGIIRDEFDGKADPESRDIVRLTVSIMGDAYNFGREAEAADFITMAEQRRGTWKDVNRDARRA